MQVWQVLAIGACAGLASLMLVPIERVVSSRKSPLILRATTLLQPALLTAVAVGVGCILGPSVGLGSPLIEAILAQGDVQSAFLVTVPIALLAGAFLAMVLILYELRLAPKLPKSPLAAKLGAPPLATRLLYGGIVEELIARWGLVSLFVWIAWRLSLRPTHVPSAYYWVAISASAVLFAAGHLPLLFASAGRPPVSLARISHGIRCIEA